MINLLGKLNVPIHMSSQIEECLGLLTSNRDRLISELNVHKATQLALKSSQLNAVGSKVCGGQLNDSLKIDEQNETLAKETIVPVQTPRPDETHSEISSCLDSNYESDNNSVVASAGRGLDPAAVTFGLVESSQAITDTNTNVNSGANATVAGNSIPVNSSDESDATLNECRHDTITADSLSQRNFFLFFFRVSISFKFNFSSF